MKKLYFLFFFTCLIYCNSTIYAQTPFTCTGEFYISIAPNGQTNNTLYEITIDANNLVTFTQIGTSTIGHKVNGIGYRSTDNLIYGFIQDTEELVQIDANGNGTPLAILPITANHNVVSGDVTPNGQYLILIEHQKIGNVSTIKNIRKVDLTSPTYTTTSIPLTLSSTGATNSTIMVSDVTFNPITGELFSFDQTNQQLVKIDINTGVIDDVTFPTTTTITLLGAMMFDSFGDLYGYGRLTSSGSQQDFFKISQQTGHGTLLTTGPSASRNDGCSCPYTVDLRKQVSVDTVFQCEEFEVKYSVANTSGVAQSMISLGDTFPSDFVVSQVVSNPFGGTLNGIGTNQFAITNMTIPLGNDSLVLKVRAASNAQGTYSSNGVLFNLPTFLGGTILSDNPTTVAVDDATPITVIPIELGENILACNNTSVSIGLNLTTPINNVSYSWNTIETTPIINVTQTNDYILTVFGATCSVSDTINVTFMDTEIDLGNDTSFCINDNINLDANFPNVINYLWQDGSTNSTFNVTNSGTYFVTLTDSLNCTESDTIVITDYPLTQVDLGIDLMYVCDSSTFTIYPNYTNGNFLWQNGTINSTFIAIDTGFYNVQYTDINTCQSSDTIELFAPPIPTVNLGNDVILCQNDSLVLDVYQGNFRSVIWSNGSTDSILVINNNISATYSIEFTDTNGCMAFDTISITYIDVFTQLRTDTSICHSDTLLIDGTQPNVTYLWSTNETTNTIQVNQDTAYWLRLTDVNGCHGYDTFNLAHHPVADLGTDIVYVCDSLFFPLQPTVTHGTFLWQNGSTDSIFYPNVQGIYWVEITDTNNCYSTDTVNLIPVTSPITDIGLDTNICFGQPLILDATTDFIRHYYWNDSLGTNTFNVVETNEYIVEVIDSNGCNAFDTAMIWVNQVIPDIGIDTSICDLSQLLLDATQPNIINYQWQDNSNNTTFLADTGLYHVTLTDTLGCQGSDSIFITYRQIADLGTDKIFICDSITFNLSANIAGVYQWNTGQTDSTIINNQEGIYYINITDEEGCFSSDTIVVTQITHPTVELGIDTNYCIGETYLLDATESLVRSYVWQDSSVNNTFLTNSTGLYHVELTDSFGCKAYDSVMVWVNEVIVDLGNDTTICHDATILFNVAQPNMSYLWQDNSTNSTFIANQTGTYFVTLTDSINCTDSDTIIVNEFPVIDLGIDKVFKCDSSTFTIYPNFQTGNFLWQNGSTNSTYTTTQPQEISLTYVDAANCVSYDTILLFAPPIPPIDLGNDTILCENVLYNISIFNEVGRSYLWQDASTNDNFTIAEAGKYYAEITDTNGCTNSDTLLVEYFLNSNLELGNDTIICENINWQINLNVDNAATYEWQDGTTTADYTISNAGIYWVNVRDFNNCTINDTITVDVESVPSEIFGLPTDTIICENTTLQLSVFAPNATDYLWKGESAFYDQNDVTDTTFLVTYTGTYELTASNRCAGITQFMEVTEEDCGCYPFVPNGFTPNNDGRNDEFKVFSNCVIQDYEMLIFDRWGNKVYYSTDVNESWDGTAQSSELQTGVYVWQMRFSALNEQGILTTQILSGDVTLVK